MLLRLQLRLELRLLLHLLLRLLLRMPLCLQLFPGWRHTRACVLGSRYHDWH